MFGIAWQILTGAALAGVSLPLLWWSVSTTKARPKMASRLRVGPQTDLREIVLAQGAGERVLQPGFGMLAGWARAITPGGFVERLERKIGMAGVGREWPAERVLATKVILGAGLGSLLFLRWAIDPTDVRIFFVAAFMAIFGFVLPDLMIGIKGRKRQDEIGVSLPDVLDQITIAVEAGLGFEAALAHVSANLDTPLGDELGHTLQDIKVGITRAKAFDNLNKRTDVPELRQFVVALQQAEKLGVPIAQVLRIQAGELRTIRKQKAEENAQKLPVKMILPLIMCILPALVIVVLAPAIFDAMDAFS